MSVDVEMQQGIHWPYCIDHKCSGCMPKLPDRPPTMKEYEAKQHGLDLSIFFKP